jgi:archaetidylinositol phosphate synthase
MDTTAETNPRVAIDQWLARRAARLLAYTPVTPNILSLFGMIAGLYAGWLYASGDRESVHWAAAIFVFATWMDHVDGEHARLTAKTSTVGHYVDHFAAVCTYLAMFIGASAGLRSGWLGSDAIVLGATAGLAVVAIFSVRMWEEVRHGRDSVRLTSRYGFSIEDLLYLVAPVTWLGFLDYFVAAAGIGAPLFLIWVIREAIRRSRGVTAAATGSRG